MVKKPVIELIMREIDKKIPLVRTDSNEEESIALFCAILVNANDITPSEKELLSERLTTSAKSLSSHDEQRMKNYLIKTIETLNRPDN
ncbi:MAG: hypothetical protein PHO56_01870 [Patescibacteria group bacterium]|nr:hypothetical protein [Patescibacteria group bacterium]